MQTDLLGSDGKQRSTTPKASLKLLVKTLLFHYYAKDLDQETMTVLAGDWLTSLQPYKLETVIEARRQWLLPPTGSRAPKISDIVELIERIESGQQHGAMGAPPSDLSPPVDGIAFAKLSPTQKWSWYARQHAFCEATGLKPRFDMAKKFHDLDLVDQAKTERFIAGRERADAAIRKSLQADGGDEYRAAAPAPSEAIRPEWKTLRFWELTAAERALCEPLLAALVATAPQLYRETAQRAAAAAYVFDSSRPPAPEHVEPVRARPSEQGDGTPPPRESDDRAYERWLAEMEGA